MAKHRTHSIAFERQVVQEYLAGETLHGLARRHELSRTLIRIRVETYEAGARCDSEAGAGLSSDDASRNPLLSPRNGTVTGYARLHRTVMTIARLDPQDLY